VCSRLKGSCRSPHHRPLADALVIIGSDKRGTIFGTYTVSEQLGVSPWYVVLRARLAVLSWRHLDGPKTYLSCRLPFTQVLLDGHAASAAQNGSVYSQRRRLQRGRANREVSWNVRAHDCYQCGDLTLLSSQLHQR